MKHAPRIMDTIIESFPVPWLPLPTTQSALSDMVYISQNSSRFDQDWKYSRFMPWRFYYLDYFHLQQIIKQDADKITINRKLEDEWKKVHDFYMLKRGEIERRIEFCRINQHKSSLQNISADIHYLHHFAKLNYCGFLVLLLQCHRLFGPPVDDKLRKTALSNSSIYNQCTTLFQLAVQTNSLYLNYNFIVPLAMNTFQDRHASASFYQTETKSISSFHPRYSCMTPKEEDNQVENLKNHHNDQKGTLTATRHPLSPTTSIYSCETALSDDDDGFSLDDTRPSRSVKKYWIHPDNVVELMLYLSTKMVVQDRKADTASYSFTAADEVGRPHYPKSDAVATQQHCINFVNTVYLDTPQFDSYDHLVRNKDATSISRIRWYDEDSSNVTVKKFTQLEKKIFGQTENNSCRQQQLIQQRVWLKSKYVQPWLDGNYSISSNFSKDSCQYRINGAVTWRESDKQRMLETCSRIEHQIHSKDKVPVLRVTQNRVVYGSMDGSVYISIDTDIAMMPYQQTLLQDDYPYISSGDTTVRFPYCVVQISATGNNKASSWISDLTQCTMLEQVDNFSTYLHGVGMLFRDQVETVPSWLSNDNDIRHPEARGQWLIKNPTTKKEKSLLITKNSNDSMITPTKNVLYCSTTTIATIVTCYDDELDEEKSPSCGSSSKYFSRKMQPSPSSATLSPMPKQGLRRSFESYCSFDHPTSSRSDPHNCRSCTGRMFNMKDTEDGYKIILPTSASSTSIYQPDNPVTFGSFLFQTFLPRWFRSMEKEPLLGSKKKKRRQPEFEYSSTASSSSTTLFDPHQGRNDEEFGQKKIYAHNHSNEFSRATILTVTCVIMSFSVSYVFYVIVMKRL